MDEFQTLARIILGIAAVFLGMSVLLLGIGWLVKRRRGSTEAAPPASSTSNDAAPSIPIWFWVMSGLGFLFLAWLAFR